MTISAPLVTCSVSQCLICSFFPVAQGMANSLEPFCLVVLWSFLVLPFLKYTLSSQKGSFQSQKVTTLEETQKWRHEKRDGLLIGRSRYWPRWKGGSNEQKQQRQWHDRKRAVCPLMDLSRWQTIVVLSFIVRWFYVILLMCVFNPLNFLYLFLTRESYYFKMTQISYKGPEITFWLRGRNSSEL